MRAMSADLTSLGGDEEGPRISWELLESKKMRNVRGWGECGIRNEKRKGKTQAPKNETFYWEIEGEVDWKSGTPKQKHFGERRARSEEMNAILLHLERGIGARKERMKMNQGE